MRSVLRHRAPGLVNLIGEHTDYNDGFVIPVAIDRYTSAALASRGDRLLVLRSAAYADVATIDLDRPGTGPLGTWSDYVRGVAAVLERQGFRLRGADISITTDVPIGAGLSSSAALEVVAGYGLLGSQDSMRDDFEISIPEVDAMVESAMRAAGTIGAARCGP